MRLAPNQKRRARPTPATVEILNDEESITLEQTTEEEATWECSICDHLNQQNTRSLPCEMCHLPTIATVILNDEGMATMDYTTDEDDTWECSICDHRNEHTLEHTLSLQCEQCHLPR